MTDYEFRPADWDRFQHYKKKTDDGKPARPAAWIKNYVKLIGDPNYRRLSATQRALLHGLWLWWAAQDHGETSTRLNGDLVERWSQLDVKLMNTLLALDTKISTWEALSHAGFLELRASKHARVLKLAARADVDKDADQKSIARAVVLDAAKRPSEYDTFLKETMP